MEPAELTDVLATQPRYASRLARTPGTLLYEEVHKLFSLSGEIHTLRSLGIHADDGPVHQFTQDVRRRLTSEPATARETHCRRLEPGTLVVRGNPGTRSRRRPLR